jgi:hypothetical protein
MRSARSRYSDQPAGSPSSSPSNSPSICRHARPQARWPDADRAAEEVIVHLAGLVGSQVTVTLEVEAQVPSGVPDSVVRTVTENSRTLRFTSLGFEAE